MVRRDTEIRPAPLGTLLVAALLLAAGSALADQRIRTGDSATGPLETALSRALADAQTRLQQPECREVFSEFRTPDGRDLQENLAAAGADGSRYLESLVFFDGNGLRRCDDRGTLASTSPKSRVVYLCGPQFLERVRRDPGLASTLIIHEELHSLGLGENPPTSKEITARIIQRCGR